MVGQDGLVARGEVDQDDLAERGRGAESDRHRSARDGQAADDPCRARHDRARLPALERDRVQVRAPAVADAEEDGAAVAGELRRPPGYAGPPGITLRSSAAARSTGSPPSSGRRSRRVWPIGLSRFPATTSADPSGVHTIAPPTPSSSPTELRSRPSAAATTYTGARKARSASGAVAAANASRVPSGDHAGSPACQSPSVSRRQSFVSRSTTWRCLRSPRRKPAPSAW